MAKLPKHFFIDRKKFFINYWNKKQATKEKPKTYAKYDTTIYETPPESNDDIFVISTDGDRCDLISQQYYGTTEFWWFIASVNNLSANNIEAGTQVRVPVSTELAKLK